MYLGVDDHIDKQLNTSYRRLKHVVFAVIIVDIPTRRE